MTLFGILIPIIVVGVLMWLVSAYVPMPEPFKKIVMAVAVIVTILWLLSAFGLLPSMQVPIVRR